LGYIEPVLLVLVSIVLLHEKLLSEHILTYMMIWGAVCLLIVEGLVHVIRSIRRKKYISNLNSSVD
ncbi:MAG: hypothetical protein J6562_06980, partial [Candidatus Schmidhempelia sp.]|nr:hypothetical protein [Candidatus Schmidhempelia sp.]